MESREKHLTVFHSWWASFQRRHPERSPAPLSQGRSMAADPEMLGRCFDLLEETLAANKLEGKPGEIFNMDESGMPLDLKAPKLVFRKGSYACALGSGNKSQVTGVACVSATGFALPPMVIWDRKNLAPELAMGEVPSTIYGLFNKGWIDHELLDVWFSNHFLRYAPSARPLLLLMDGHSSHYCPDDECYNAWLAHFHPSSIASHVWKRDFQSTGVSKCLSYPTPPCKVPTFHIKSCGRILTSLEKLAMLEEKRSAEEERKEKRRKEWNGRDWPKRKGKERNRK